MCSSEEMDTISPAAVFPGTLVIASPNFSDEHIYKGGEFLEYGAYVNVVFKTGVTRADCEKFNEAIFTIMEEDLKVPKENVYTTFQYCDDFGVQGKFL